MPFGIDVRLHYQLGDDPVVLLVLEAARTAGQTVTDERFEVAQAEVTRIDAQDGLGSRAWARVMGGELKLRYRATVDVTRPAPVLDQLGPTPVHALPGAAFTYLRPSRFCQSDMFQAFVGRRFGGLAGGPKVAAITEWVGDKLSYVPASSAAATTALDTFVTREGVCRDYAHVVCALARAAGIPARYAAAYAPDVDPPDFHAVAQVWLEGAWHMVDATGMSGRDGAALIAVGRDAGDVAFMETWAPASMIGQSVSVMRLPS